MNSRQYRANNFTVPSVLTINCVHCSIDREPEPQFILCLACGPIAMANDS